MRITGSQLRQIIREELNQEIDEMALAKTSYYHDVKSPADFGIEPAYPSFNDEPIRNPSAALPMNAKYMERAKMQLQSFPLPVNVIWLEGSIPGVRTRTVHGPGSTVGQVFSQLHSKRHGSAPDPNDFNILIRSDSIDGFRGPDKINYSIQNSFHQLFDAGPFEANYAIPIQKLAYQYIENVAPDIAESLEFQEAKEVLETDYENWVDYDNFMSDDNSREFKKIFTRIFQGRTIRLGIASSVREICNEALTFSLMAQRDPVKTGGDPSNVEILMKMSSIASGVPALAGQLVGMTLYAGL